MVDQPESAGLEIEIVRRRSPVEHVDRDRPTHGPVEVVERGLAVHLVRHSRPTPPTLATISAHPSRFAARRRSDHRRRRVHEPARTRRVRSARWTTRSTSSSSCSTRSIGTCSGRTAGTEFATPNLDRFAARSTQFTNHVTGSLPCMPARHDILVGALDFLWKPWGSIELWEESITATLRRADVTTMLVSDHPHLFETGGENYHSDFSAWDYLRGHEGDPWRTCPDPSAFGAPTIATPPTAAGSCATSSASPTGRSVGATTTTAARGSAPRRTSPGRARWRLRRRGCGDRVAVARSLDAVRRRVRPARAVRHARAVGVDVRRHATVAGRARDGPARVAAVHRRRYDDRHDHRGPGPPDPQQLRRQAVDDRSLVRQAPR